MSHLEEHHVNEIEDFDLEEQGAEETDKTLSTTKSHCNVCGVGKLTHVNRTSNNKVLIYGRHGTYLVRHEEYRCNNRNKGNPCRARYFHGYKTFEGNKIYEDDALKNEVLMVSRRTGFTIEYLVEITGNLDINSCTFEGLAKLYNRVHNGKLPYDILAKRVEVCRKRIADAFFLYSYLELAQRYNIPNYYIIIQGDLDLTIEQHQEKFQTIFREKWSLKHKCDKPGCGKALIVDAGLKPHRKLCGAKLSGIREFQKANVKVFTGCRKIPKPESKFCQEHEETDTPVVPAEKVSRQTRRKLRDFREDSSKSKLAGQDNFYIV